MVAKNRKIAILGAGNVGATIAYSLALEGVCSEIVLVDVNKQKAEGEALDISQCEAVVPSVKVRCGEYEDVKGADIIVVTFGIGRKPDQTRLDLAKVNIGIIESVMPNVAKIAPDAIYVIVSNPVDVLTYATIKCTGLSASQVIGTGTLLDSNRLIKFVADYCKVDPHTINAYVLGEHGNNCVVPWSLCTVGGLGIDDYAEQILDVDKADLYAEFDEIYNVMVRTGSVVIKAKGATFYAIAASVLQLIKAIFADTHTLMPLSTILNGEYGAKDLCMGVPCLVGAKGIERIIKLPLDEKETKDFDAKIVAIYETYDALGVRK